MHVHVHGEGGEAKIWMEPTLELARNEGLTWLQLGIALRFASDV